MMSTPNLQKPKNSSGYNDLLCAIYIYIYVSKCSCSGQRLISFSQHQIVINRQNVSEKVRSENIDLLELALKTEDPLNPEDQVGSNSTGLDKSLSALQIVW